MELQMLQNNPPGKMGGPVSVITTAACFYHLRCKVSTLAKAYKCVHLLMNPDSSQIENLGMYHL